MRIILFIIIGLFSLKSYGQGYPINQSIGSDSTLVTSRGGLKGRIINWSYTDTTAANLQQIKRYPGAQIFTTSDSSMWVRSPNANKWMTIGGGSIFDGNRPITRDFTTVTGVNLGTTTISTTLETLLYPSQVPTATLTGGGDYELHSAGTFGVTLNWSAGRQASTNPLSTIVVASVNQSFSQPAAPGTVSGTQGVTITWNTNVSYTNLVTTTDSKTASASTAFSFYPKRYWGVLDGAASSADIVAAVGGGSELTTSKSKSTFTITVVGTTKFLYYAYPASYGALSSIIISGIESIGAFTSSTVSVTNASGYVQNYLVYKSVNFFNNTTVSFNSVN